MILGKAIIKFHINYFNEEMNYHKEYNKSKKINKIYQNKKTSYRIYGIEYNHKIEYNKYNLNNYLYKNNISHWRKQEKYKNVLKGFFLKNYCKFLCFNYQSEIFFFLIIIFYIKKIFIIIR